MFRWIVPANQKLDAKAREKYDKVCTEPAHWHSKPKTAKAKSTAKKKRKNASKKTAKKPPFVELPAGRNVSAAFNGWDCRPGTPFLFKKYF